MKNKITENLASTLIGYQNLDKICKERNIKTPIRKMIVSDEEIEGMSKIDILNSRSSGYTCQSIEFTINGVTKDQRDESSLRSFVKEINLSNLNYYYTETMPSEALKKLIENIHKNFKEESLL